MDRKIHKETLDLNYILDQMDLRHIQTFHSLAPEYIFFSRSTWNIPKTDHMLGHKTYLNKFNIEIIPGMFFWTHWYESRNQYEDETRKFSHVKSNTLLNNQWVKKKSKSMSKLSWNKQKWKCNIPKLWVRAKAVLRGKFIALCTDTEKKIYEQILYHKELEKQVQNKPKVNKRKKIIKSKQKNKIKG